MTKGKRNAKFERNRECEWCGSEYTSRNVKQRYCCRECQDAAEGKRKARYKINKNDPDFEW